MPCKSFFSLFFLFFILSGVFAQSKSLYSDFPNYNIKTKISGDKKYDFVELYSQNEKSTRLVCINRNEPSEYTVLFENRVQEDYSFTAMFYSKKSDTLYFHIIASPALVNNSGVYYDAGLYAFYRADGKFSKEACRRYFVPEKWIFNQVKDAFLVNGDYRGFIDFVYSISDSCEKKLCVITDDGNQLCDEEAAEYIWRKGLFNQDSYTFLNKYLKKVENGKLTKKSAFTLNGFPQLKDSVCKDTLNVANFVQSEDGLWFINEKSKQVEKIDEYGNKYTKWEIQYLTPYLLEDKNGNLVREQPEVLKSFKILPVYLDYDFVDKGFLVEKGCLLMRDMDGRTWWTYKNGKLFNKPVKTTNIWFIFSLILFIFLVISIVINIILHSKKIEQHLNKKDKRLIFTIQNNERTKISRDLHDSVVQTVRAIRTDVEMLKVQPEESVKQQQIIKEITDSVVLLRNICYNLSPAEISLVENSGGTTGNHLELLSVIDTLCKQFSQKTKIPCSINTDTSFYIPVFTLEVSKYVIRIIQEILTNIEKHSFATSVNILISNEKLEENEMLKIVVIDDGIGCEQNEMIKNKHHFGVRNIIETMNLIGGKVEFYTKPNEGMSIVLKVPCQRVSNQETTK
ncbi:MAG: hypothetical protein K5829_02265 [Treponema sp.]|nr:hypothetical protein [Treponema sp.]